MTDPTSESVEVHIPKTRNGGVFAHPSTVNLHANDFSLEEKNAELTPEEQKLVETYLSAWQLSLEDLSRGPHQGKASPPQLQQRQPWESHYSASHHSFPLKNYIVHAFPALNKVLGGSIKSPKILECGCGTGSTLLPLMKFSAPPDALFVGFDVASSSVKYFSEHEVAQEYIKANRLCLFTYDVAHDTPAQEEGKVLGDSEVGKKRRRVETEAVSLKEKLAREFPRLANTAYDAVLLVFVLSALESAEDMRVAIRQLRSVMKPGGVLLFRDYALPDHNFFRFLSKTGGELENGIRFMKGDGTSQVFFEKHVATQLFEQCGFVTENMEYHCNRIVNRKNGKRMDKIFLNATFRAKV